MKRLIIALITGLIALSASPGKAQVSINFNIGSQPAWGPTGYDRADYYYLPDIETYYYVPRRQFIYQERGNWVFNSALPSRYRSYNLNDGYKVVINSARPYQYFSSHRVKYAKYKGYNGKQSIIRYSKDPKYSKSKISQGNSYSNGAKGHSGGNGNSNGSGNGKGKSHGNGNGKGKH